MRRHRLVAIPKVDSLVRILVPAVLAFVSEVLRHLRLFRKEVAGRVVGDLSEDAFSMTTLPAQHPFRIGRHNVGRMTSRYVASNITGVMLRLRLCCVEGDHMLSYWSGGILLAT